MQNYLKNIKKKITENLPDDLDAIKGDLQQNIQSLIESQIKNLDLVTREEFEVQEQVLKRTRVKLEELEKQLDKKPLPEKMTGQNKLILRPIELDL